MLENRGEFVTTRIAIALVLISSSTPGAETARPATTDCGMHALFVLFQVEGRPVGLEQLDRALPPRRSEGSSMTELSRAAGALGLTLKGVRMGRNDVPLDRPAIAFLKDAGAGHFVVLRPVGTSGAMVQVIDPPYAPRIVDYDWLFRGKLWTGRVLSEDRPARLGTALRLLSGAAGLVLPAILSARRVRRREEAVCSSA